MINIDYENKTLLLENSIELTDMKNTKYEWCENKDDVSAKDIFRLHKKNQIWVEQLLLVIVFRIVN